MELIDSIWTMFGNSGSNPDKVKLSATVLRIDDEGHPWVHINGGVDETPVHSTVSDISDGDTVIIRIEGGKAYIEGSTSAPSVSIGNVEEVVLPVVRRVETVEADSMKVHNLTANQLNASVAYIDRLNAERVTAENLVADHATVGQLDAFYAHVDAANIDTATIRSAWVNALMVQSGLIAHEGNVFTLDAIQVNAANITAGTLDVERLMVTGQDGHKYLVHVDGETTSYEKLDGDVIEDLTITADKIVAEAVTAEKITTENIVGTGGWINLRSGKFQYVNATTGQGITWDGSHLMISGSVAVGGIPITLEQMAEEAKGSITYDHTYEIDGQNAIFTAWVTQGTHDITSQYPPQMFVWWLKTEDGCIQLPSGRTVTVSTNSAGLRGSVIGGLADRFEDVLEDAQGTTMQVAGGSAIELSADWEVDPWQES